MPIIHLSYMLFCICTYTRYPVLLSFFFFFNDTATTEIYTLSLHDALPISSVTRTTSRMVMGRYPTCGAALGSSCKLGTRGVGMAGHSKWKQIKRKKAVADARRGALFTRLIREITIAAKQGGGDPDGNARLRTAIDAAKAENMPLDNIERAVKKGTGELEGVQYQEVTYEGYGPGGAAIFIEATTDNPNRTVAEIRYVFQRHGGNLGAANSVAWMFDRKAQITVDASKTDEDATMEAALEAGADDMVREGDVFLITGPASALHAITTQLGRRKIPGPCAQSAGVRRERRSSLPQRLEALHAHITNLINRHHPQALALENAFYSKNVRTTLVLGHARGVVLLAAEQAGLEIAEYPPATVKKTVAGAGGAPKARVGAVVARLLKLRHAPTPADAADGVAVALTHILRA